jgi:hypothetical protein
VTTVEAKWCPHSEYSKFTPAKKQKHYQLIKTTNKTNKSSATVVELMYAVSAVSAAALAISELTAATNKRTATEDGETNDNDVAADSKWGQSCNNPTIFGRQALNTRSNVIE